jgi:hypothetical protein
MLRAITHKAAASTTIQTRDREPQPDFVTAPGRVHRAALAPWSRRE